MDQSKFVSKNDFAHLFFSFRGRTKRIHYWGAIISLWLANLALGKLFYSYTPVLPLSPAERVSGIIGLILTIVLQWSLLAVTVKRWHDRNRSGWMVLLGWPVLLTPILFIFLSENRAMPEVLMWLFLFIDGLVLIWIVVELGFLRGTDGPNRYGTHW